MTHLLRSLSLLAALCLLSSCKFILQNNGENDGKNPIIEGNAEGYGGYREFYWLDPDYKCTKDGVQIASYRGFIEVVGEDKIRVHGDACTDSVQTISKREVDISGDKTVIGFQDGMYELHESPPIPDDKTQSRIVGLCRGIRNGENGPAPIDMIVRASGEPANMEATLFHWENGVRVRNVKLPVQTALINGIRSINSTDEPKRLTAAIDVMHLFSRPRAIGYLGRMQFIRANQQVFEQDIFCRLLPSQTKE